MDCVEANRSIEPQRREFAVRLYRWAEQDLQREIDSGFRRVRKVKSSRAFHYLDFLRSLPVRERPEAAVALFRAAHRTALERLGESLTTAEISYISKFQSRFHPVAFHSEFEKELLARSSPDQFKVNRDEFQELLEMEISRAIDQRPIVGRACLFRQQIGSWFLETGFDVHSIYQLRYGHYIKARNASDLCPVQLREDGGTTLLGWLGVDPSTSFNLLRKSELAETASFLAEIIHYYVSAVPLLLEGLTHNVPAKLEARTERSKRSARKRSSSKGH